MMHAPRGKHKLSGLQHSQCMCQQWPCVPCLLHDSYPVLTGPPAAVKQGPGKQVSYLSQVKATKAGRCSACPHRLLYKVQGGQHRWLDA